VLCLHIDRFSEINLAHGNAVGNAVLQHLAGRLRAAAPPTATVARLGGDEFAVVWDGPCHAGQGATLAGHLAAVLSQPCAVGALLLHLEVHVGLRLGDAGLEAGLDTAADDLLQDAGIAMREARRGGPGRHALFDPAMKARAVHRAMVERELRQALARGELFVVYQPIVALGDGAAPGVEALVRWQHPQRGLLAPAVFIDVAEQTGLIGALGAFVLDTACRQFMQWRQALGPLAPQALSVNLSRAQLADPDLPSQVQRSLQASGMPAAALQLEVTESLAAQDELVRSQLQALQALGLGLALDDFGTGYSSLSSLHQLPVGVVKIDRSFVSQLETSAHHRALVKATVDVAQSLGMGTVAEGIETAGQARLLQGLQCQKGQGYWIGRPMRADLLPAWLAEWQAAPRLRPQRAASAPAGASRSPSGSAA